MRKLNKYKTLRIFPRGVSLKKIPSRVLNFRRPKWNFLQKKFPRRLNAITNYNALPKKHLLLLKNVKLFISKSVVLLWKRLVSSVNFSLDLFLYVNKYSIYAFSGALYGSRISSYAEGKFGVYTHHLEKISLKVSRKLKLLPDLSFRPGLSFKLYKNSFSYKKKNSIINPFLVIKPFKFLERRKRYYKNSLETKSTLLNFYENFISFDKLKKNVCSLKRYNILNYLIRPHYQINILLSNLHFFSTPFQASQEVYNKRVLVNGKNIELNLSLKKGDVITFARKFPFRYFKCFLQRYSFDSRLFSFVEVDYETETIIIIKEFFELTLADFHLLIKDFIKLKNLTYL